MFPRPRRSPGANGRAPIDPPPGRLLVGGLASVLLMAAVPLAGQAADSAGSDTAAAEAREGPPRIGAFVYTQQGEADILVTPDTASSLDEGTRLFLRCRGGNGEVFIALTGEEGGLGNEREGAAGQFRIDRGPWTDLEQWGANSTGTAAFMKPESVPTFVGRAEGGGLAEIRIVNPAGVRHRYVFRLEGFEEALGRLGCMDD